MSETKLKKITIYTNGFVRYFFIFLILLMIFFLLTSIKEVFLTDGFLDSLFLIIGPVYLFYFILFYLFANQIKLSEKNLKFSLFLKTGGVIPKKEVKAITLKNIEFIYLGTLKYFDSNKINFLNTKIINEIENSKKRKLTVNSNPDSQMLPVFSAWIAEKYTPFLLIIEKNGESSSITTKPFSKKDFKKLLGELENRNIKTIFEDITL